jgi:hypothetical protein
MMGDLWLCRQACPCMQHKNGSISFRHDCSCGAGVDVDPCAASTQDEVAQTLVCTIIDRRSGIHFVCLSHWLQALHLGFSTDRIIADAVY